MTWILHLLHYPHYGSSWCKNSILGIYEFSWLFWLIVKFEHYHNSKEDPMAVNSYYYDTIILNVITRSVRWRCHDQLLHYCSCDCTTASPQCTRNLIFTLEWPRAISYRILGIIRTFSSADSSQYTVYSIIYHWGQMNHFNFTLLQLGL